MAVLTNSKHEQFAQAIAKGVSATKAYVSVGYSEKGAQQSSARMLLNAVVCSRIAELQQTLAAGMIALEISSRNARVQALQDRWDRMRRVIDERASAAEFAGVPGGTTGLLCVTCVGKDADRPVYKVDTAILAELRAHELQAAEELAQWKTRTETKVNLDVSPVAMTLAELLTHDQLLEMERKLLEAQAKAA
jgi:hypothetical protein